MASSTEKLLSMYLIFLISFQSSKQANEYKNDGVILIQFRPNICVSVPKCKEVNRSLDLGSKCPYNYRAKWPSARP
jgi:hypothetical protein